MSTPTDTAEAIRTAQQTLNVSGTYEMPNQHYYQNHHYGNIHLMPNQNQEFNVKLRELYQQYSIQQQMTDQYSYNQSQVPQWTNNHHRNYESIQNNTNVTSTPTNRTNRIDQFKDMGIRTKKGHKEETQTYMKKNRNNQRTESLDEHRFNRTTENITNENETTMNENTLIDRNKQNESAELKTKCNKNIERQIKQIAKNNKNQTNVK